MDQHMQEMRQEFQQSKREGSTNLISGRSPFTENIQEEPIPTNFYLLSLEAFDDSINPLSKSLLSMLKCYYTVLQIP